MVWRKTLFENDDAYALSSIGYWTYMSINVKMNTFSFRRLWDTLSNYKHFRYEHGVQELFVNNNDTIWWLMFCRYVRKHDALIFFFFLLFLVLEQVFNIGHTKQTGKTCRSVMMNKTNNHGLSLFSFKRRKKKSFRLFQDWFVKCLYMEK